MLMKYIILTFFSSSMYIHSKEHLLPWWKTLALGCTGVTLYLNKSCGCLNITMKTVIFLLEYISLQKQIMDKNKSKVFFHRDTVTTFTHNVDIQYLYWFQGNIFNVNVFGNMCTVYTHGGTWMSTKGPH